VGSFGQVPRLDWLATPDSRHGPPCAPPLPSISQQVQQCLRPIHHPTCPPARFAMCPSCPACLPHRGRVTHRPCPLPFPLDTHTLHPLAVHCAGEMTVILCVIPANVDFSTAAAIKLAKKHDPAGERTMVGGARKLQPFRRRGRPSRHGRGGQ